MTLDEQFLDAQNRVQKLATRPSDSSLLELYSLYKQAQEGDATGKRPGMLDFRARAKWDAWASRKGMASGAAKAAYLALVDRLVNG